MYNQHFYRILRLLSPTTPTIAYYAYYRLLRLLSHTTPLIAYYAYYCYYRLLSPTTPTIATTPTTAISPFPSHSLLMRAIRTVNSTYKDTGKETYN